MLSRPVRSCYLRHGGAEEELSLPLHVLSTFFWGSLEAGRRGYGALVGVKSFHPIATRAEGFGGGVVMSDASLSP